MQSRTVRIFVVDDQRLTSSNVSSMLLAIGLAAESFIGPYHALIAVARSAPDLLIWDITMPLISQVRLVECVNLRYPRCFSILISGQVSRAAASIPSARIVPSPLNPYVLFVAMEELGFSLDLPKSLRASTEKGMSK